MHGWQGAGVGLGAWLAACGADLGRDEQLTGAPSNSTSDVSADASGANATDGSGSEAADSDGFKLDVPPSDPGCEAVDFLFVIDNSASMQTYQLALGQQFPDFADAMFEALPPGLDVHVGITTTDFDNACAAPESTQSCQSTASVDEITEHYKRPDVENDGGNGSQGRLFQYAGQRWFETTSDDDPAELSAWFSDAAVAAGEDGCSFEMPVAAAGFVGSSANATTNEGFIRDEGALLVVFFLTDEPDKSPESKNVYRDMILAAKSDCGGEACVFMGGLVPACTLEVNQKLWQFMTAFGQDAPPWGDIAQTQSYSQVFGDALATAIAEACANVPVG